MDVLGLWRLGTASRPFRRALLGGGRTARTTVCEPETRTRLSA